MSLAEEPAHVLYQHAIVDALTPSRRADLSRRDAEALLRRYGDAATAVASQLALLFEVARDFERAADFFLMAAANAAALFANEEAVGLSRRASACAERLDGLATRSHGRRESACEDRSRRRSRGCVPQHHRREQ